MSDRRRVLVIVLVLGLTTSLFLAPKASCSSTISRTYERTLYLPSGKEMLEMVRFRIDLSIETEADETWRNNSRYHGLAFFELDWYNPTLFPNGVNLVFEQPEIFSASVNCTFAGGNLTLSSAGFPSVYWNIDFDVTGTETFRYSTFIFYTVYNSSFWSPPYGPTVGRTYFAQPAIYITIADEKAPPTYQQVASLNQDIENLGNSLLSMQTLVYVLIALSAASIGAVAFLGYSVKKSKRSDTSHQ